MYHFEKLLLLFCCFVFCFGKHNTNNAELSENFDDYETVIGSEEYQGHDPESDRNFIKPMDAALAAVYAIITIVGLIANGIVFFVIFGRNEINKTVTAIYVVQLAIADSIFLFSVPIFGMQKVTRSWSFGQALCTICQTLKFFNYYAGVFFLTAMSVDRYVAVAYSARAQQLRTKSRTVMVCAMVWLISAILSLPIAIFSRTETVFEATFCKLQFPGYKAYNESEGDLFVYYLDENDEYDMSFETKFNESYTESYYLDERNLSDYFDPVFEYRCSHNNQPRSYKTWIIINFIIGFFLPFLVISISYVLIIIKLRSTEQRVANMRGKKSMTMRKRVTRMVAALVICFAICWLPYHILLLAKIPGFQFSVSACTILEQFLVALGFSNSAINPILYTFLGHNFKDRFCESINITKRKWSRSSMPSATGHFTRSNSDHKGGFLQIKMKNMSTNRLVRKQSSSSEKRRNSDKIKIDPKHKFGNHLLEQKPKEQISGSLYSSDQIERPEFATGRCYSPQTVDTTVMLDGKN